MTPGNLLSSLLLAAAVVSRTWASCHPHDHRHHHYRAGPAPEERNAAISGPPESSSGHHDVRAERRDTGEDGDNAYVSGNLTRVSEGLNNATSDVLNFMMQLVISIESLSLKLSLLETATSTSTLTTTTTPSSVPSSPTPSGLGGWPVYHATPSGYPSSLPTSSSGWVYPTLSVTNEVIPVTPTSSMPVSSMPVSSMSALSMPSSSIPPSSMPPSSVPASNSPPTSFGIATNSSSVVVSTSTFTVYQTPSSAPAATSPDDESTSTITVTEKSTFTAYDPQSSSQAPVVSSQSATAPFDGADDNDEGDGVSTITTTVYRSDPATSEEDTTVTLTSLGTTTLTTTSPSFGASSQSLSPPSHHPPPVTTGTETPVHTGFRGPGHRPPHSSSPGHLEPETTLTVTGPPSTLMVFQTVTVPRSSAPSYSSDTGPTATVFQTVTVPGSSAPAYSSAVDTESNSPQSPSSLPSGFLQSIFPPTSSVQTVSPTLSHNSSISMTSDRSGHLSSERPSVMPFPHLLSSFSSHGLKTSSSSSAPDHVASASSMTASRSSGSTPNPTDDAYFITTDQVATPTSSRAHPARRHMPFPLKRKPKRAE